MSAVARTLGVSRSNLIAPAGTSRRGRRPLPDEELRSELEAVIEGSPSYGYRRACAMVRRRYRERGQLLPNHKRIYRVMQAHQMLLQRCTGAIDERRHDGKIARDSSDERWCSDGFEISCENGEHVRVAFSLDCCDREVIRWVATTAGINGDHIRDLMLESVEQRGTQGQQPQIEWLSDNGSVYTMQETRQFAKLVGLRSCTTPVRSPQSNGMAEAFIKTLKRDYVAIQGAPDAASVLENLPKWFEHYNEIHPHKALQYQSPREFRRLKLSGTP